MRPLTEAEFRLMVHLASGKPNLTVARDLGISEGTFYDRLSTIRAKLNAPDTKTAIAAFRTVHKTL